MRKQSLIIGATAAVLAFSGCIGSVQDDRRRHDRFNDHDQQVTRVWYNDHRSHGPGDFRYEDRLSADEESRFREGTVFDDGLRRRAQAAPQELTRQLPRPPRNHRYVVIGGHVALVDNTNHVKAVIHLHDNQ